MECLPLGSYPTLCTIIVVQPLSTVRFNNPTKAHIDYPPISTVLVPAENVVHPSALLSKLREFATFLALPRSDDVH